MVRYLGMHSSHRELHHILFSEEETSSSAWRERSEGNRTEVSSLEDWRSTIELITHEYWYGLRLFATTQRTFSLHPPPPQLTLTISDKTNRSTGIIIRTIKSILLLRQPPCVRVDHSFTTSSTRNATRFLLPRPAKQLGHQIE